jgi:hypothetical protein
MTSTHSALTAEKPGSGTWNMHFTHATWVSAGLDKTEPSYLPPAKDETGVAQAANPFSANNGVSPVVERIRYTTYNCGAVIEITSSPLQEWHRSIADVLWQMLGEFFVCQRVRGRAVCLQG